jgi:hypothetical protein
MYGAASRIFLLELVVEAFQSGFFVCHVDAIVFASVLLSRAGIACEDVLNFRRLTYFASAPLDKSIA